MVPGRGGSIGQQHRAPAVDAAPIRARVYDDDLTRIGVDLDSRGVCCGEPPVEGLPPLRLPRDSAMFGERVADIEPAEHITDEVRVPVGHVCVVIAQAFVATAEEVLLIEVRVRHRWCQLPRWRPGTVHNTTQVSSSRGSMKTDR